MNKYRMRSDGSIKTFREIKQMYNASLSEPLSKAAMEFVGCDLIFPTPKPETSLLQTAYISGCEQDIKGNWVEAWKVKDKFADQIEDGVIVKTKAEFESEFLDQLKAEKLKQLHQSCDNDLKQLATGYPERETQTWAVQLEEAKAYLADNTKPTPFISAALKQGETVEQYAQLIVANNAAWSDYAGKVVLKRRTYETLINSAQTVEEANSINWEV